MARTNLSDWVFTSPLLGSVSVVTDPRYLFMGEQADTSFGNPVPVTRVVESLLLDGDLVIHDSDGNRTVKFYVGVRGSSSSELAANGEALVSVLRSATSAAYTAMDGRAPVTVFDVLTADPQFQTSEVDEINMWATYAVELTCGPFVHSKDLVRFAAPAQSTGTLVVIADGTSAAGWTASNGATVSSTSGKLSVTVSPGPRINGTHLYSVRVTDTMASTDFSLTPYVAVDAGDLSVSTECLINGVSAPLVSKSVTPSTGQARSVFYVGAATAVTTLTFGFSWTNSSANPPPAAVPFDNVTRSGQLPSATPFQRTFAVPLVGSVRTPISLQISAGAGASGSLGSNLVAYTSSMLGVGGYSPPLRQYGAAGTASNSAVSGSTSSSLTSNVPVAALPRGSYVLAALLTAAPSAGVTWSAQLMTAAGVAVGPLRSGTTFRPNAAGFWGLASLSLPEVPVDNASPTGYTVQVIIKAPGSGTLTIDEGWVYYMADPLTGIADGGLTVISAPSAWPYAWIESASFANKGRPAVYVGANADGSDRIGAGSWVTSWGHHEFMTPTTSVFTVAAASSGGLPQTVSGTYLPTWQDRAAA